MDVETNLPNRLQFEKGICLFLNFEGNYKTIYNDPIESYLQYVELLRWGC